MVGLIGLYGTVENVKGAGSALELHLQASIAIGGVHRIFCGGCSRSENGLRCSGYYIFECRIGILRRRPSWRAASVQMNGGRSRRKLRRRQARQVRYHARVGAPSPLNFQGCYRSEAKGQTFCTRRSRLYDWLGVYPSGRWRRGRRTHCCNQSKQQQAVRDCSAPFRCDHLRSRTLRALTARKEDLERVRRLNPTLQRCEISVLSQPSSAACDVALAIATRSSISVTCKARRARTQIYVKRRVWASVAPIDEIRQGAGPLRVAVH